MQFRIIGVLETKGQFSASTSTTPPTSRRAGAGAFNRDGLMEIHVAYAEGRAGSAGEQGDQADVLSDCHGREDFTITTQEDMLRTLARSSTSRPWRSARWAASRCSSAASASSPS